MTEWTKDSEPVPVGAAPSLPGSVVDRRTLADWLVKTCEAFGAKQSTALQVAGKFIEQLEKGDDQG